MATDNGASAKLVALAKEVNRGLCDLNAQFNVIRAQLLELAREMRAAERVAAEQRRSPRKRHVAALPAPRAIWHFGQTPDDAEEGRHTPGLARDARD